MSDKDQLDDVELSMFSDIARNMHNINSRVDSGGEKSGLTKDKTEQLAQRIIESGRKNPTRHQPQNNIIPEIPDDMDQFKPLEIDEDLLREAAMQDVKMTDTQRQSKTNIQSEDLSKNDQPQAVTDPNQLNFGFDVVKADDVYNVLYDLKEEVKKLRNEIKDLKNGNTENY